jgi:exopolysaccharide biosynthesis polyprenyl glycosylphosphotransferase
MSFHARTLIRLVSADIAALLTAALVAPSLLAAISSNPATNPQNDLPAYAFDVIAIPLFMAVFGAYHLYRGATRRLRVTIFTDLRDILHALMVAGFLYALCGYILSRFASTDTVSLGKVAAMCAVAIVTVPLYRALALHLLAPDSTITPPVIVVGTGKLAQIVAVHLRSLPGVRFLGFVDDNPYDTQDYLGSLDELPEICQRLDPARILVCFSRTHPERTTDVLRTLSNRVGVSVVPRYYELVTSRSVVDDISGLPTIDIAPSSLSTTARFVKRTFDIVASSIVLVLVSPVLVVSAIAIKFTSHGPVFFTQTRTGRHHRPFSVLKFRTMTTDAEATRHHIEHLNEADGPLFKVKEDPRITRVGRILRPSSIDELPQLINVLKGDMSLVGPRPFIPTEAALIDGWAAKRFEVRPGMTGLWQVSGRNELTHLELCRLDYLYVASWSLGWDVQILWQTPGVVFRRRGAS